LVAHIFVAARSARRLRRALRQPSYELLADNDFELSAVV
jgi:hypothetical protein